MPADADFFFTLFFATTNISTKIPLFFVLDCFEHIQAKLVLFELV